MKISSLQVRGFGKIENFRTAISTGLNVIYGPNESGKSTLMAFIKAMLYGLKGGRASKEGLAAESKRYMPWSNASYGGYMNFELDNGSSYRIDRAFDNGAIKLFDESFNDVTSRFLESKDGRGIAEKLIGLNESLFERTVYIKQLGTRIDNSSSKDLIDRISNIRQSGSEDISYKKADAALKEALKLQVGTEKSYTRPLDIINKRLGELSILKTKMQDENRRLLDARKKSDELNLQIDRLKVKERLFVKLKEFCELKEGLKLQNEKNEEINFLNDGIRQSQKNINVMDRDKELIEVEIDNNSKQLGIISQQQGASTIQNLDEIHKQRNRRKALNISSVVSLMAAIVVGCGAFIFKTIELWVTAVPVLISVASFVFRVKCSRALEKLEQAQRELCDKRDTLKNELSNVQKIDQILQQQLVSINGRLVNEKTQHEQLVKRLENQNINFKQVDIAEFEKEIDTVSETISSLAMSEDIDLTRTEKELFENILEDNNQSQGIKINELKEFLTAQILQKQLEKATVEVNLKINENMVDEQLLEEELIRLTKQKRNLEQRGEALSIAIKTLEESANDVQKKYIPIMNKSFNDTFSRLTTQKYSDVRAGENLSIMLNDPKTEMVVPVSMLSSGTIDQMYLAIRISISETVLKINEGLPFIMDEPFAQYDDERTENALKCIYDISKKQQVIIFTCKQREVELISNQYPCKICSLT